MTMKNNKQFRVLLYKPGVVELHLFASRNESIRATAKQSRWAQIIIILRNFSSIAGGGNSTVEKVFSFVFYLVRTYFLIVKTARYV